MNNIKFDGTVPVNEPQLEDIKRLAEAVRGMHYAGIVVRKDGQDLHFEADWLGYLMPLLTEVSNG